MFECDMEGISLHHSICNFSKSVIKCYLSQFFDDITFLEPMPLAEKLSSTCMIPAHFVSKGTFKHGV